MTADYRTVSISELTPGSILATPVFDKHHFKLLDAGTVVNPEMARNQFEGAAVMGTSIAFYGEITATNGVIDQSNFDTYPVARMNTAPREVHVHIVESDAPPGGIGEPGLPAIAPAICNAIFAATGKRIRELPLTKAGLA